MKFYETLNSSDVKPAILKITPPHSKQFIPLMTNESLPQPVSQLYEPSTLELDYLALLSRCEEIAKGLKVVASTVIHILFMKMKFLRYPWNK